MLLLLLWILIFAVCCLAISKSGASCDHPYTVTDGKYVTTREKSFYTEIPFQILFPTRSGICLMIFMDESKAISMNIVEKGQAKTECQFFGKRAVQGKNLLVKDHSTYYEKIENYLKATSSVIHVGAKGNNPGTFVFQLPSGPYKIRLNHLYGGLVNYPRKPIKMPFGGFHYGYIANLVMLVKQFDGPVIAKKGDFTEWEGDGMKTTFIATSQCFHLNESGNYSFWYSSDFFNYQDGDNYGQTSFEILVQLCENASDCG